MIGNVSVTSTEPAAADPTLEPTELRAFLAMLHRSGSGFGTRHDYDTGGESVQVEHPDDDNDVGFWVTEWSFDADGAFASVSHYRGEPG